MSGRAPYRDTLNLPRTDFPMRADLPRREPEILAEWQAMDLYGQIQALRADAPSYILHDGPPYTSGHIHYGHILNKILKDLVVKVRTMAGFRSPYVPGWDTHGLPIELQVERELGERRAAMSAAEIRAACRAYALRFVDIQRTEFRRLGVLGDWDRPYLTLDPSYEAAVVRALAAFARGGYLYRGKKPVYWCPRDATALAEAEIEYADHTSPSIYVSFPLAAPADGGVDPSRIDPRLAGKKLALPIWTTTPWTLPANLAIVLHPDFAYVAAPSPRDPGTYFLVARDLAEPFYKALGAPAAPADLIPIDKDRLRALEGARYRHPLIDTPRADADFRVWFADYVTLEQGTGLVHTAPGHGADDYKTGVAHGLTPYAPVDHRGRFTDEVPAWAGQLTWDANPAIVAMLAGLGALLNRPGESVRHSYPHCWRCKGPVLFRATPQWFAAIDHAGLRERALGEIDNTTWIPPWGKARIAGMIQNRPDWTLSRQRIWGVPIPAFHCTGCGETLADAAIMDHVADLFAAHGADLWHTATAAELVPPGTVCPGCGAGVAALEPEKDIVDVWFESGSSWLAIATQHPEVAPIDLYLEGSDQHRGWFHSSLLIGIAVAGRAPYREVLTHGFVLDEDGRPYSKSEIERARREGKKVSYVAPEEIIDRYGAELFRLWVASTEFRTDIPYSQTILTGLAEWYRKFRNTCRFILGNLSDFTPDDHPLESQELGELDRFTLARLGDLVARVRGHYDAFEFHLAYRMVVDYVADLSATYLDMVKDTLYTEAAGAPVRRAVQAVLYTVLSALTRLVAPILCFTAEDVWRHLPGGAGRPASVHLADLPSGRRMDEGDPLARLFATLFELRERVTRALEPFRAAQHRSTDARVLIRPRATDRALLGPRLELLRDLCIVSEVALAEGDVAGGAEPEISVEQAPGSRCERCWRWYREMAEPGGELCRRCAGAVAARAAAAARGPGPG